MANAITQRVMFNKAANAYLDIEKFAQSALGGGTHEITIRAEIGSQQMKQFIPLVVEGRSN